MEGESALKWWGMDMDMDMDMDAWRREIAMLSEQVQVMGCAVG